jgi:hypothetical protein
MARFSFTSITPALLALLVLGACAGDDASTATDATTGGPSTTDDPTTTTTAATTTTTAGTTASTTDASGSATDSDSDATTTSTSDATETDATTTAGVTDSDATTTTDATTTDATTDATTGMDCVPVDEICDNGVDDDCDGDIDEKLDYDVCGNGIDDNCDGKVDEKLSAEICGNGLDDDCNGKIDDGIYCTDSDEDGIPDADDPFPNDKNLPGKAEGNKVYAHTSSALFTMGVTAPYDITSIGAFKYDKFAGSMTDVALDRWGVLYGITFGDLFVCNPANAQCYHLASIPQSANGLTFLPPGTLDPNDDTLVAIAISGAWYKVTLVGNQAQFTQMGQYGAGYGSAGDVFSIQGVGTYGATTKSGVNTGNVIVEANPLNGNVVKDLATLTGYTTIYGLAGWQGKIFAFNSNGAIVLIDPGDNSFSLLKNTPHSWWGAGVYTVLPQ